MFSSVVVVVTLVALASAHVPFHGWMYSKNMESCETACSNAGGSCNAVDTASLDSVALLKTAITLAGPAPCFPQRADYNGEVYVEDSDVCQGYSATGPQICCCMATGCSVSGAVCVAMLMGRVLLSRGMGYCLLICMLYATLWCARVVVQVSRYLVCHPYALHMCARVSSSISRCVSTPN
jgi:hypothetical protein